MKRRLRVTLLDLLATTMFLVPVLIPDFFFYCCLFSVVWPSMLVDDITKYSFCSQRQGSIHILLRLRSSCCILCPYTSTTEQPRVRFLATLGPRQCYQ